ncbi:MAG TPA: nicotinamide mononucleotide transporter, partial [Saprospiraceae bacterium]|nr:nicotinamide mononucleotide transporter [Saprospiraceae bacterium]
MYYAEIIASFFAVIYIFSAAREQYISWWWSVISSLFWAYASFVYFRLYVDVILQIFYIGIAF